MNEIDYILLGVIVALAFLALRHIRRNPGGCRGCAGCQYRGECNRSVKNKNDKPN
jgi:hypothetical protein